MDPTNLRNALASLRRQWWVILQAMVIVAAGASWLASRVPPNQYQAVSTFSVKPEKTTESVSLENFLVSQRRVLLSQNLLADVASRTPGMTTAQLKASLKVTYDVVSSTISITAYSKDPQQPVVTANALANVYIETRANQRTTSLQTRAADLDKQVKALDARIVALGEDILTAKAESRDESSFTALREGALRQYETLYGQQQTVITELAAQIQLAELIEPATESVQPPVPSPVIRGILGAFVGLLFGLGLAVLREVLDDRLRTTEQAEEASDATVLVQVPRAKDKLDLVVPVFDEPQGAMAESIRSLRTTVRFLGMDERVKTVSVTSAAAGDGKSLVAANLAAAYAMAGSRTILISGDLRRPSIDRAFGVSGLLGLSDVLIEHATGLQRQRKMSGSSPDFSGPIVEAEQFLCPTQVPNLFILPAGSPVPNPGELLASPSMSQIVEALAEKADMVIIDSPPTIVADSVMLAKSVDGVLVVASLNITHKRQLKAAVNQLTGSRASVLGIVLNRSADAGRGYRNYYPQSRSTFPEITPVEPDPMSSTSFPRV
jgi:Mrp family chromosome partitioning ATPase/capsular polysaccharide biosynthesis protein